MSHKYFHICTFTQNYSIENHFNTRYTFPDKYKQLKVFSLPVFVFGSCFEIFKGHLKNTVCAKLLIMLCAPIASNSNGKGCVHVTTLGMEVYVRVYLPLFQCIYQQQQPSPIVQIKSSLYSNMPQNSIECNKTSARKETLRTLYLRHSSPFLPPQTPLFQCSSSLFYSLLYIYLSNELK